MTHNAPLARLSTLGLVALASLAACSGGGGSGGGRMYVTSCVLGCNSGSGGQDVACGIVNTHVNQDLAFQFSEPVDLAHVIANPTSFQVIDEGTGTSPAGEFLLDPADKQRLIWRPQLSFGQSGAPTFSLVHNGVYTIEIKGTSTAVAGPFVESVDGKENESRVRCTINTTLGINDPIPGAPKVSVFVDELDPVNGGTVTKEVSQVTGQVASTSLITIVFDDIMNVGTVVTPSSLTAPFITINTDPDGLNLSDPSDQFPVPGVWTFAVDQTLLTTTAVFTPTGGLPSGGMGERKIVVNIPPQVVDLKGNSTSNGGLKSFTPEIQVFTTVTIPPGGEMFMDQSFLDQRTSGADWGETTPGVLAPGQGGGSGRLGALRVGAGESLTLNTSPIHAELRIEFETAITSGGNTLVIGDPLAPTTFSFKNAVAGPLDILRRNTFAEHAVAEVAVQLNNFVADPLVPEQAVIEQATYTADGNFLVVTWDTPGTVGNGAFFFDRSTSAGSYYNAAGPTLTSGGLDAVSFGGPGQSGEGELLTNFDFQANPAGTPPPYTVDDGVFEFSEILIEDAGTVVFEGLNPGRLFARGRFEVETQGLILAAGENAPDYKSNSPLGQPGRQGGPAAGDGGMGADRPDNTGSTTLLALSPTNNSGLENPGFMSLTGRHGEGVGDANATGSPTVGAGRGGTQYPGNSPADLPQETYDPGLVEMDDNTTNCICHQVAGPGSGGAYAQDGGQGLPMGVTPTALPDMLGGVGAPNAPSGTAGGQFSQVGLPNPGVTPVGARDLDPDSGNLRGGSGGGGGGASVEGTQSTALMPPPEIQPDCTTLPPTTSSPTPITVYRSHSGAAGGGGGGAVQVQAGRMLTINGVIDAGGGDGGSSDTTASPAGSDRATPGGGGSGGAALLQSRFISVSPLGGRVVVAGGLGGTLFDNTLLTDLSIGGGGSAGLVRAESVIANPSFFDEIARAVDPYDVGVADQSDPNDPNAAINWLSVDTWDAEVSRPGSFSAGQSCWYKPAGNYLFLDFEDDSAGLGWDMDLTIDTGSGPMTVSYRGDPIFAGNTPQEHWGNLFSESGSQGAPIVVRFQGAQTVAAITDPCSIDLFGPGSPIDPTTVTEWVMHPDELNAFPTPPDVVRFVVLFDAAHPDFSMLQGVTNLRINALPQ